MELQKIQNLLKEKFPKAQLVAVSKLQPTDKIRSLYQQGQRIFAENYVQEALSKQQELKDLAVQWHFIGKLQKNKVKTAVGKFALIHSVDSLALAKTMNEQCIKLSLVQPILLQLNIAGETTKSGFSEKEFLESLALLKTFHGLSVQGLMTMPPLTEDPEDVRPYFCRTKELLLSAQEHFPDAKHLSMGTTHDYLVALEEGATLIRLGTLLFGARPQG